MLTSLPFERCRCGPRPGQVRVSPRCQALSASYWLGFVRDCCRRSSSHGDGIPRETALCPLPLSQFVAVSPAVKPFCGLLAPGFLTPPLPRHHSRRHSSGTSRRMRCRGSRQHPTPISLGPVNIRPSQNSNASPPRSPTPAQAHDAPVVDCHICSLRCAALLGCKNAAGTLV